MRNLAKALRARAEAEKKARPGKNGGAWLDSEIERIRTTYMAASGSPDGKVIRETIKAVEKEMEFLAGRAWVPGGVSKK